MDSGSSGTVNWPYIEVSVIEMSVRRSLFILKV